MAEADCARCGAPERPGFVICPFCRGPYSEEAMQSAIPCAHCHTLSAWGQTKCVQCASWIVVKCLFCDNLSPMNQSACLSCNEPFAGMGERKAAREAEISRHSTRFRRSLPRARRCSAPSPAP